jgi:DNA-binding NarL/FixJ family response regulator
VARSSDDFATAGDEANAPDVPESGAARTTIDLLTSREREVITRITAGGNNRAIARELAISENTVRHYLMSIFAKLGVDSRRELVIHALEHRLGRSPGK